MKHAHYSRLQSPDDQKIAKLAMQARLDTINGGARAAVIAKHEIDPNEKWDVDPEDIVGAVYSASTGKPHEKYEAWECPECGTVHLGQDYARECCSDTTVIIQCGCGYQGETKENGCPRCGADDDFTTM